MYFFRSAFLTLFAGAVALFSHSAFAQEADKAKEKPISRKQPDTLRVYQTPSVTVTSTRAAERKTPTAFTEISGADVRQRHTLQDLPALLGEMPSTVFYSDNGNNVGYTTMTMRGFDQRRIAVLVNGIPQNDPEDHNVYWIDFPDMAANLQSIQVQRGAGMVNYGAAAVGGSVNLTTANFANERFARFSGGITWQQYDGGKTTFVPISNRVSAEVSSGLTGNYALYARLSKITSAGYRDRSWSELGSYFLSAARFDEKVTTQITFYGGPLADGLAYNGIPKQFITDASLRRLNFNYFEYNADSLAVGRDVVGYAAPRRVQEIENFSQPHYEILNDIYLSDNLTLKSTLFYYSGDGFFDFDGSWADTTTVRLTEQYGFHPTDNPRNAILRGYVANRHGGWIPRVVLQHENGELTAGAEIRLHRSNHYGQIHYAELLPEYFDSEYKIYEYDGKRDIFSIFAREQYDFSPTVRLTGELQIVRHRYAIENEKAGEQFTTYTDITGKAVGNGAELFSVNYTFLNPRLGINFNPDDNFSGFVAIALTSREPRMRNLYAAEDSYFGGAPQFAVDTTGGSTRYNFTEPLVKPERLLNIEIGGRYTFGVINIGIGLYWMNFYDEFVKNGKLSIFGAPIDGNAERTRHIGVELDAAATLFHNSSDGRLTLGGNLTLSRNRFVEYQFYVENGSTATPISLNNNPIGGFPDVIANLRADYTLGGFRAGASLRHVGASYTDNFGERLAELRAIAPGITDYTDNVLPAYTVVNADVSYKLTDFLSLSSLKLNCAVNNVFNLLYAAGGMGKEFFPAAGRSIFLGMEAEM